MSDQSTVGDPPESSGRDSENPDPGKFVALRAKIERGDRDVPAPVDPASSHHESPLAKEARATPHTGEASELNWLGVIDELPFAIVIFDSAQQVIHENHRCREIAAFSIVEKGGIEEWLSALCPDREHRSRVLESWHTNIWSNQGTQVFSLRIKDQKLRELEFRSTLNRDGGITVVIEDVTDRLKDEENRIHTKKKYRGLFENTENGTVLVDRTGRIIEANPAFVLLAERSLRELRMSSFSNLLHPRDAALLATPGTSKREASREEVTLECPSGEKAVGMRPMQIGARDDAPSMTAYLFDSQYRQETAGLKERIGIISGKAVALLNAVPDLIFLVNEDFTIADFIPPPDEWSELEISDSWRGQKIGQAWPLLGQLLDSSRKQLISENKTVRAELSEATDKVGSETERNFSVTASPGGDGQLLVVVRQKEKTIPSESGDNLPLPPATSNIPAPLTPVQDALSVEAAQHDFRNQIQLVTSLFSLEPQGTAAKDAFLRWQIRLRSMAQAVTASGRRTVILVELLRAIARDVCSLTGSGPCHRAVVVSGSPHLKAESSDASLLALTSGELMRLVLATRQHGRGPEITFDLDCDGNGNLVMKIRAGENRHFQPLDEESELETLEILASQMRGQIAVQSGVAPTEWELVAPILRS